ncbi:hypothetical protein V8G54_029194 [Vigna mungo]|uniref:WAT1-related protein n=1 Tax=Vigna mungo TaxID=3915 RepID=A0AAQ3MU95_VIGMU
MRHVAETLNIDLEELYVYIGALLFLLFPILARLRKTLLCLRSGDYVELQLQMGCFSYFDESSSSRENHVLLYNSHPTFLIFTFFFPLSRSERPRLTFSTLCSFFLLAFFGSSGTIMAYVGIELSSPTLASALINLLPAFTFILALIFRMEEAIVATMIPYPLCT